MTRPSGPPRDSHRHPVLRFSIYMKRFYRKELASVITHRGWQVPRSAGLRQQAGAPAKPMVWFWLESQQAPDPGEPTLQLESERRRKPLLQSKGCQAERILSYVGKVQSFVPCTPWTGRGSPTRGGRSSLSLRL